MPRKPGKPCTRYHVEQFLRNYCKNGYNGAQAIVDLGICDDRIGAGVMANYYLKRPYVKAYLKAHMERATEITGATFENKVRKLWHVIDKGIDETKELDPECARVAITATAELNKMQGHYSPEKHTNVNINANLDVQKAVEIDKQIEQKIEEYKTGY